MAEVAEAEPLEGYTRYVVSEQLRDRYPYLEDIRGHLKADEVTMASGDRLLPRLVEQLVMPDISAEQLVKALRVITDLCSDQENKANAIKADVIAAATNLLTHESIPVRQEAARAIQSAALLLAARNTMTAGCADIVSTKVLGPSGTVPRLSRLLLTCTDEVVKKNVAEALGAITIFRDGCQLLVDEKAVKGIAQYLCATLPNLPPSLDLALCLLGLLRTLAAVTMYAKDGIRDVLGVNLIAKICSFLGRVPREGGFAQVSEEESTETVKHALRVLWHVGNDPAGRKEMLKADGVRVVTFFLNHKDAKVREVGVCALNVASLETPGKAEVLKHSVKALSELLHSSEETPYLHETAVQLCRCAAELPAFRFAFARKVLRSVWLLQKVFGTTALAAVNPLLDSSESDETRSQAAQVMAHFLTSPSARGDEIRVPPVCPLALINDPAMYAFQNCVDVLQQLCSVLGIARQPAMTCLRALMGRSELRDEMRQLLEDGRVTLEGDDLIEVQALLAKGAQDSAQRA